MQVAQPKEKFILHSFETKLLFLIIYFIIVITTEIFYRNALFNLLPNQHSFQQTIRSYPAISTYFEVITLFGSQTLLAPIALFISLLIPIHKLISILLSLFFSVYFDNIMKLIYSNPRPYWEDPSLFNDHCDIGYGNPSGHSFTSAATYLSIWYIITDYSFFKSKRKGKVIRVILLYVFILFILSIMLSRIYLGVHSFNQIIYGFLLGVGTFLLFFWVFEVQKYDGELFFRKYKQHYISIILFFILCFVALIVIYLLRDVNVDEYIKVLEDKCKEEYDNKKYRLFKNDGMYGSLIFCGLFGGYCGYLLLVKLMEKNYLGKEEKFVNWGAKGFGYLVVRFVTMVVFCFPFCIKFVLKFNDNLGLKYVFEYAVPYFLVGFLAVGPGLYFGFVIVEKWDSANHRNTINIKIAEPMFDPVQGETQNQI